VRRRGVGFVIGAGWKVMSGGWAGSVRVVKLGRGCSAVGSSCMFRLAPKNVVMAEGVNGAGLGGRPLPRLGMGAVSGLALSGGVGVVVVLAVVGGGACKAIVLVGPVVRENGRLDSGGCCRGRGWIVCGRIVAVPGWMRNGREGVVWKWRVIGGGGGGRARGGRPRLRGGSVSG
jgi:hypothetical protein